MAFIVADRVKETTNSTGTGTYALGGATAGFQAFSAVTSNTDTVYYAISDNVDFEVGVGTYATSGNSISRTTILSSSNSNSAVNWGVGTKDIFLTYPAEKAVLEDVSNNVTIGNNLVVGGTVDGRDVAADGVTADAALPRAGGTMSGNLILNADPTIALQSATKQYVDTIAAAGIHYHQPCRAETTANLNATYSNGSSGVGATLTNAGTQAAIVVDGVTLSATNRVMIQLQTNQAHNGVYTVTTVGSASTNWVLTRATDADSYAPSDPDTLGEGDAFFITEGTVHGGELDVMTTTGTIVFGTTNIVFALVSDAPIYTAGTGLSISGTEFSLVTPVSSATALATGRTIGMTGDVVWTSASFDGTGNVSGTATIQANSVALGTDTTGNYVAAGATSGTGISGSVSSEGGTFTVTSNATNANTASTIVARDGSGNFAAGTVTGDLSGNASTATALATGRTIGMTGDVVWTSGSFDGSGNVTGTATIQANSVALGTDTTGNYVQSVANGSYLTGGGGASEGTALTLGVDATNANTASKVVARDVSGNFSAGTVTAALSGNASTATTLQTARTINGVSFNGAANIIVADSTKLPLSGGALTGAVTTNSTFDGRNVSTDGDKLDLIEANADVTDVTNVTSAGALMDSEVTNLAQVKAFSSADYATAAQGTLAANALPKSGGALTGAVTTSSTFDGRNVSVDGSKLDGIEAGATADQTAAQIKTAYESNANTNEFSDAEQTKLSGIEASADVTDATNVTSAGALMDSEVTNLAQVKAFSSADYATSTQGTTADNALPKAGGALTGAVTTNSTFDGRDVATDGSKLDGIAASANNYSLPLATDTARGGIELFSNTDQTVAPNAVTATASRTYGLQLNAANQAMVNVPWTNTNTTYSAGTALDLSGTTFNVDLSELSTSTTNGDGDYFIVTDTSNAQRKLTKGSINNSGFNNDAGFTTNVGDITGVTAGTNLTGGGTSGTVTLNVTASPTFTTVTATTFNTTSDRNTKTDIVPISNAVSKVQQLGGYSFTFKDSGEKSSGVIAQEVQAVLPELVQESDAGNLTVQYGNMVGLLIEAIKEQQAQIDALTAKLNG